MSRQRRERVRGSRRQMCGLRWQDFGGPCPFGLRYESTPRSRLEGRQTLWLSRSILMISVWWCSRHARARFRCLSWVGRICSSEMEESAASWSAWRGCGGSRKDRGPSSMPKGAVGMPTLIGYAIRHSLAGLEWAAGIPGTVAGCVVMNAGTKLGEMKDSVKALRMVNMKGHSRGFGGSSGEVRVSTGPTAARHRCGGVASIEARGSIGD